MTFREQTATLISYARNLSLEDATEVIELHLKLIHNQGVRDGIEEARQSICRLDEKAAA